MGEMLIRVKKGGKLNLNSNFKLNSLIDQVWISLLIVPKSTKKKLIRLFTVDEKIILPIICFVIKK